MSHYQANNLRSITDQEILIASLAALGFKPEQIEVHEKPVQLRDFYGSSSAQRATIVIRKASLPSFSYVDIGFAKNADGTFTVLEDVHSRIEIGGKAQSMAEAVTGAYGRINADRVVTQLLTKTVVKLKELRRIPRNATVQRVAVGQTTRIVASWQ